MRHPVSLQSQTHTRTYTHAAQLLGGLSAHPTNIPHYFLPLLIYRSLVKYKYLIPGGGAPETELSLRLERYGDSLGGMQGYCIREYAKAFEIIPYLPCFSLFLGVVRLFGISFSSMQLWPLSIFCAVALTTSLL